MAFDLKRQDTPPVEQAVPKFTLGDWPLVHLAVGGWPGAYKKAAHPRGGVRGRVPEVCEKARSRTTTTRRVSRYFAMVQTAPGCFSPIGLPLLRRPAVGMKELAPALKNSCRVKTQVEPFFSKLRFSRDWGIATLYCLTPRGGDSLESIEATFPKSFSGASENER